jgi:hypothetical protein
MSEQIEDSSGFRRLTPNWWHALAGQAQQAAGQKQKSKLRKEWKAREIF